MADWYWQALEDGVLLDTGAITADDLTGREYWTARQVMSSRAEVEAERARQRIRKRR